MAEVEASVRVHQHQADRDVGARELRGLEKRPATVALAQLRVVCARLEREADACQQDGAARQPRQARPTARGACCQQSEPEGRQHVLERQHVREHARAAARVVAVEVERRVDGHLQHDPERKQANDPGAPAEPGAERHQQEQRREVERVAQVHLHPSQGRSERRAQPEAFREVGADEVAVLAEAANPSAKSIAEAVARPVAQLVVRALRRAEDRARGSLLVRGPQPEPGHERHDEQGDRQRAPP